MEQPVEQPNVTVTSACVERKRKNALYKYTNNENIPYQFSKISKTFKMLITALKRFRIFPNLFDSQRVGTPIINEWTGVAVYVAMEKSSSNIPTSKMIRSCSYGQTSYSF